MVNRVKKRIYSLKRFKQLFCLSGVFLALSSLAIPLSSTTAKEVIGRTQVSIGVGIAKYIGIETVDNEPGTDVDYSDGIYSKTMVNGENLNNFGTTTFGIICNFNSDKIDDGDVYYGGYDCDHNGWGLIATPVHTTTKGGVTYTSMIDPESSATILSQADSFTSSDSNWAIKVSPVAREIEGVSVAPTVTPGYNNAHHIPPTSTEIASGKSWKTIGGVYTYIDKFGVSVQHGINIGSYQAAGTYVGAVNYTAALRVSE